VDFHIKNFKPFRNDLAKRQGKEIDGNLGARRRDNRFAGTRGEREVIDAERRTESSGSNGDFAKPEGVAVPDLLVERLRDARRKASDRDGPLAEVEKEEAGGKYTNENEARDRPCRAAYQPIEKINLRPKHALQQARCARRTLGERIFRKVRPGARIFRVIDQTKRAFRERARAGKPIRT
jgi:hypothetical protein